ncbi:MAG: hypothetical protein ABI409_08860 [Ramlibacter sp.]
MKTVTNEQAGALEHACPASPRWAGRPSDQWKDGRYVWKPGEWVLAKPGMEYRQHKWVQRADGKWILTGGDWVSPDDKMAGKH